MKQIKIFYLDQPLRFRTIPKAFGIIISESKQKINFVYAHFINQKYVFLSFIYCSNCNTFIKINTNKLRFLKISLKILKFYTLRFYF